MPARLPVSQRRQHFALCGVQGLAHAVVHVDVGVVGQAPGEVDPLPDLRAQEVLVAIVQLPVLGQFDGVVARRRPGELEAEDGPLALLAGGVLMIPVTRLRRTLPRYMAIYGLKNGSVICGLTTILSMSSRIAILIWVLLFYHH